jgi:molecular chaperone DnaK
MSNIVGIDLGTTMSAIAALNSVGKPEIIPNKDGERITPSVIKFESSSHTYIGTEAKNSAATDSNSVAKEFKREMHNDAYRFNVHGDSYTASDLSSFILKKLTQDASTQVGSIKDVVISVPAYFKESQRNATMQAGQLAGLNVIAIINEPTAAALYYASTTDIKGKGLVYDLGGGTFDVTVTKTDGKDIQIIASAGDHHLGGVDFDQAMLELIEEKYKTQTNGKLYADEDGRHEFLLLAEDIKKSLSSRSSRKEKLAGEDGKVTIEITQSEFEEKISTYISRTELLVEQVLDEADCEESDIDYILLVGGSSRIPAIQKSIKKVMGKEPLVAVNVDEAVALGAAIKAGLVLVKDNPTAVSSTIASEMRTIKVGDVANHSYGAIIISYNENLGKYIDVNSIILKKNTPLPSTMSDTFYTTHEGQEVISIKITQGEDTDPDFVDKIDEIQINLPSNRPDNQPIEVKYSYDENQIMHCEVKDVNSGKVEAKKIDFRVDSSKKNTLDAFLVD